MLERGGMRREVPAEKSRSDSVNPEDQDRFVRTLVAAGGGAFHGTAESLAPDPVAGRALQREHEAVVVFGRFSLLLVLRIHISSLLLRIPKKRTSKRG
jgi:hypothetical protein